MTAHDCKTLTPGCYRCDLNRDEMERDRLAHLAAAKVIKGAAMHPSRRPATRWLLLETADGLWEQAQEIQQALIRVPTDGVCTCPHDVAGDLVSRTCAQHGPGGIHDQFGPTLATADDVIEGRARYVDTPGGHADRKTQRKEAESLIPVWCSKCGEQVANPETEMHVCDPEGVYRSRGTSEQASVGGWTEGATGDQVYTEARIVADRPEREAGE